MREFFNILFEPGEGLCTGNAFANEVLKYPKDAEFFSINPLSTLKDYGHMEKAEYREYIPRRADINVTCFRNFMFEMDSTSLENQLTILRNSEIPFTSITYSGGKSYHAILSVGGGACSGAHTTLGLDNYKNIWKRLAAKLDREARKAGFVCEGPSFIDPSCKNPSRLSRFPETMRDNGNMQELVLLTERMDKAEFNQLLAKCPKIVTVKKEITNRPVDELETVEDFQAICPANLMRTLKFVDWAKSEGMYPTLYRLTTWAIDETNVSKEAFIEFLERYTFKSLLRKGYPAHKLHAAVNDAYNFKRSSK